MPGDVRKRPSTSSTDEESPNYISLETNHKPSVAKRKSMKSPVKQPSSPASSSSSASSPTKKTPERFRHYTPIPPLMAAEAATEEQQRACQRQRGGGSVETPTPSSPTDNEQNEQTNECPWVNQRGYTSDVVGLHHEIRDFLRYISPTDKEKRMREEVIERIQNVIVDLWPHAMVKVFGSYKTGLYLPMSDVDLVVFGKWPHIPLRTLEKAFIKAEVADAEGIQVIDKASVPIIKVVDKATEVRVDISFNMPNSVNAVDLVNLYMDSYPTLRFIVFILKQFLNQRDLNEVYFGGVSSYSIVLMTISFLQLHPRFEARSTRANLGVLLLEFFELYGLNFNYNNVCIRIKDGGGYIQKSDFYRLEVKQRCPDRGLSIEDPTTRGNDISRGSYHSDKCAAAFEKAFFVLQHAVLPRRPSAKRTRTILGNIIQMSPELVSYRKWIEDNF